MSEERNEQENSMYKKLRAKNTELLSIQDDRDAFFRQMARMRESLKHKFGSVFSSMPEEISEEMNQLMVENKFLLEYDEELTSLTINHVNNCFEEKVQEQTMFLDNQNADLNGRMIELERFNKELSCLENAKSQKNATLAALQGDIKGECILIEQQREMLQSLASAAESKAQQSEFVEEHNRLRNESSQLNLEIDSKQKINAAIRAKSNIISEEIAALEVQYRNKAVDTDKLRCQVNYNDEVYKRAETKNQKIMNKMEAVEKQQSDELTKLEKEISQLQEMYDALKTTIVELDNHVRTEIGDYESPEQMILQANAELQKLNDECIALENAINDENVAKTANENKLSKFQQMEAKLLKDIQSKEMDEQKVSVQKIDRSDEEKSRKSSTKVPKVEVRADARDHIFIQPPATNPRKLDTPRKLIRKRRTRQTNASPVVQSADSSVSELWQTTNNGIAEEDEHLVQRHLNSLKLLQNWFF